MSKSSEKIFGMRMSSELYAALAERARELETNESSIARYAIKHYLAAPRAKRERVHVAPRPSRATKQVSQN